MSIYGYLPTGLWTASSDNAHAPQWCDGRYIWVFDAYVRKLDRFDTVSLILAAMNQTQTATGSKSRDGHSANLATIGYNSMSHVTGDDDFLYWLEPLAVSGSDSDGHLGILRRMSLAEPYYIETVDNGWDSPDGYVAGAGNIPFYGLDQNTDIVYVDGASPFLLNGIAIHDTYLYLTTVVFDSAGEHTYRLSRWPLAGGAIEPMFEVAAEDLVSGDSNVVEVRGTTWSYPYHGMGGPDLEGMDFSFSKLTVVGDSLILHNSSTLTFGSGRRVNANNVAFDLTALAAANLPVRHDRSNPWYTTVAGGSGNYESGSDFSFAVQDRLYGVRDGSQPLAETHLVASGTAGRGAYEGSFLYAESAVFSGIQNTTTNLFVHKLDPSDGGTESIWDITLSFEGKALQGYGRQVTLHGKEAPTEVTLT